jgi:hypothetical protein
MPVPNRQNRTGMPRLRPMESFRGSVDSFPSFAPGLLNVVESEVTR